MRLRLYFSQWGDQWHLGPFIDWTEKRVGEYYVGFCIGPFIFGLVITRAKA